MNGTRRQFTLRAIYMAAGSVCVALGVAGIAIPIVPTTPFLLLAAFFYARSSHRLHFWLLHHPLWGRYLQDYLDGKGIPLRVKISAITMLWVAILSTVVFFITNIWVQILLLLIAAGVTMHIVMIRTMVKR